MDEKQLSFLKKNGEFLITLKDIQATLKDPNVTLNDGVQSFLCSCGLLFEPEWDIKQMVEIELVDYDDPFQAKNISGDLSFEDIDFGDDFQLRIRLSQALIIEVIDHNANTKQLILPTFLSLEKLSYHFRSDDISDADHRNQYYFHLINPEITGGLHRLSHDLTLSDAGIQNGETLILLPEILNDLRNSIVQKSTMAKIFIENDRGHKRELTLPVDASVKELEELARYLYQDEPVVEFSLQFCTPETPLPVSSGFPIPTAVANIDLDVYNGPDMGAYNIIEFMTAGQEARITGVSQDNKWWNIIYPQDIQGRGWIEVKHTKAYHTQNVSVALPPTTLWRYGVRQDVHSVFKVHAKSSLFEKLSEYYEKDWEIKRLTINSSGLLVCFIQKIANELPLEIYIRVIEDNMHFQLPLLTLPPLNPKTELEVYEYLHCQENLIAPVRFGIDEQRVLLLRLSITKKSYRQLRVYDIDPLKILTACVERCKNKIDGKLNEIMGRNLPD